MGRLALLFIVVAGCAHEPSGDERPTTSKSQPASAPLLAEPPPTTTPPPAKAATRVELTSVTLADDCGGTPPTTGPVITASADRAMKTEMAEPPKAKAKGDYAGAKSKAALARRCEQTSMQLAIMAGDSTRVKVTSVELFDETGKSLGMLTASKPTRWSDATSTYEAWDEAVAAGATSNVSYVLTPPNWDQIGNRWNRTYTLKAVLSVGGAEQTAKKDVLVSAPTSLPPNVKT